MNKTYKREVAIALLAFLVALCVYDLAEGGSTPALKWADLLAHPFLAFALAAFGLDAGFKQGPWRGGRDRDRGRPGWPDPDPCPPPPGHGGGYG